MAHIFRNKKIYFLLFIITILLFTSCTDGDIQEENSYKEGTKEAEPEESISYSFNEYDILSALESSEIDIKNKFYDVLLVEGDLIFLVIEKELNEVSSTSELGPAIAHEKLVVLNYKTEDIQRIMEFKEMIVCYDLALNEDDEIIISYKTIDLDILDEDGESVEYYIGKVTNENNIKVLDKYKGSLYKPPRFNKLSSDLYYTYQKDSNTEIKSGIQKLEGDKISDVIDFNGIQLLDTRLFTNNDSLMIFVEDNSSACFYIINDNDVINKIYLEPQEKVFAYDILEEGVIISYQIQDTQESGIMYIDFEEQNREIVKSIDIYHIEGDNFNTSIGTDPIFDSYYIGIEKGKILIRKLNDINKIKNSSTNAFRLFNKDNDTFGIFIEEKFKYLDVSLIKKDFGVTNHSFHSFLLWIILESR